MGLGLLLLSLYGWWSLIRDSLMGRLGIVLLAIGYGAWLVDVADNIAGTVLPLYIAEDAFAVLVALGSPLLSAGLWRTSWLPRSGLLMVGVGGPIAMGLLAAPWPLGLGPVVPALAIVYAFGWISLGAAFRRMQVQTARTRAHVEMARQD